MLYVLEGLNGSGKTFMVMHQIALVLEGTEKTVGTNLLDEIILPEFNALLHERARQFGWEVPDIHERLILFPKAETPQYFRIRSGGLVLPSVKDEDAWGKRLKKADFLEQMKEYFQPMLEKPEYQAGMCYFLDECQDYFNAREWAETGRAVLWHVGKHRHLDDDVWWITPSAAEIDAGLRRKAHQWWRMQNRYQMKFKGFKMPGKFVCWKFYGEPGANSTPFETTSLRMGDGFEKTYKTTNALGVRGRPESAALGAKGPPFLLMIAGIASAVIAVMFFLWHVPAWVGKGLGHGLGQMSAEMRKASGLKMSVPASVPTSGTEELPPPLVGPDSVQACQGVASDAGGMSALFNGEWHRVIAQANRGVLVLDDGTLVRLKKAKVLPAVASSSGAVLGEVAPSK